MIKKGFPIYHLLHLDKFILYNFLPDQNIEDFVFQKLIQHILTNKSVYHLNKKNHNYYK